MLLAKRIKAIRIFLGLSQQEMCNRLGVEQSTYSGYETEASDLNFKTIIKLAKALDCSLPFLVDINSTIVDEEKWRKALRG